MSTRDETIELAKKLVLECKHLTKNEDKDFSCKEKHHTIAHLFLAEIEIRNQADLHHFDVLMKSKIKEDLLFTACEKIAALESQLAQAKKAIGLIKKGPRKC